MTGRPAEKVIEKSIKEHMTINCAQDLHDKCRSRRLTARGWENCRCPCHEKKQDDARAA